MIRDKDKQRLVPKALACESTHIMRERQDTRQTEREGGGGRERDRQTDRQTERDRERDRQTDRETERQTETERHRDTER